MTTPGKTALYYNHDMLQSFTDLRSVHERSPTAVIGGQVGGVVLFPVYRPTQVLGEASLLPAVLSVLEVPLNLGDDTYTLYISYMGSRPISLDIGQVSAVFG